MGKRPEPVNSVECSTQKYSEPTSRESSTICFENTYNIRNLKMSIIISIYVLINCDYKIFLEKVKSRDNDKKDELM